MDRKRLGDLEGRCTQEEAAACRAACPIHVDVKKFLAKVALGAWDEAVRELAAAMPLPGIVARICDHPCQMKCRRGEAGDPVAIGALERAAVRFGDTATVQTSLPSRGRRAAIVGATLSGLAAGWDLLRKGWCVAIFTETKGAGGILRGFPKDALPDDAREEGMSLLERMGAELHYGVPIDAPGWLDTVRADFDAVYASIGEKPEVPAVRLHIDPVTLATPEAGLFVGTKRFEEESSSPIDAVFEGRKAAVSIDRFLQNVSLTAGREHEGPYKTKLFTNMSGIAPRAATPMKDRQSGYDEAEAKLEAGRCIGCDCMECVKACLFLQRFKSFPKRYVRQIGNDETMVMGAHGPTIQLVNSCSLCGLCEVVCPNALSMSEVCAEGRASLVRRGKMAPSAHDFALTDMRASNSDRAVIARHEPGKEASAYAFFPGCQMAAIYPDHVAAIYAFLRGRLEGGIALLLRCCGAPADWAAREDLFGGAHRDLRQDWERLGKPVLVAACPACQQVLRKRAEEIKTISLWQVLAESEGVDWPTSSSGTTLVVHDPCTARHEPKLHESVRALLARMGHAVEELELSREKTECCGFGGLTSAANPSLAKDVARRRASESGTDYATYCAMCRNTLAASGKRVAYLPDLLFGPSVPDPAARKALGYSDRSENRFRLKRRLLESVWGETEKGGEEHERIELYLSDGVAALMEDRRILREDVQKVIHHAEKTGSRFFNRVSGRHRASFRPFSVTYWVEYSAERKGFRVHNAYCHRMEVAKGEP